MQVQVQYKLKSQFSSSFTWMLRYSFKLSGIPYLLSSQVSNLKLQDHDVAHDADRCIDVLGVG